MLVLTVQKSDVPAYATRNAIVEFIRYEAERYQASAGHIVKSRERNLEIARANALKLLAMSLADCRLVDPEDGRKMFARDLEQN